MRSGSFARRATRAETAVDGQGRRLLAADGVVVWAEHLSSTGGGARDVAVVLVHGFTQSSSSPRVRRIAARPPREPSWPR